MARMGYVPDKARHAMTASVRLRYAALERAFGYQKAASKSLSHAILEIYIRSQSVALVRPGI
jgi:hypothetical protein